MIIRMELTPSTRIKKIIGGVQAREVILENLLDGSRTGTELRWALADSFDRRIDGVSDALLYFNLQHLEMNGLINRYWESRTKRCSIKLDKIQSLRNYFKKIAPITCISGLYDDPAEIRTFRQYFKLKPVSDMPQRFYYFAPESLRRKIAGKMTDETIVFLQDEDFHKDFHANYQKIRKILISVIENYEVIFNQTSGSKFFSLAAMQLAYEFGLRCFYIDNDRSIVWIKK